MVQSKQKIIDILRNNGVGILPTDTIYGLVGSALSKKAVERIYKIKRRSPLKPFIILIADIDDLKKFGVVLKEPTENILRKIWPNSVSIILSCPKLKSGLSYLKPLNSTLAFRCPKDRWLNVLLQKTGPLVAPSANPEGLSPVETIKQAKKYFGDKVDFYVNAGNLEGSSSTLISLENRKVRILRKGKVKIL
ncbi:threonylcarbamoyl-AMP synthase [bacterium (Candidatus Gribaldobacteria) CG08_land_8_20_14_0_20_39_15]|uniref:L-threonylcarbamoyladenylate synthase n=1 Tax=bacterium (Candidatus Gribaldobacteria) CG08_land_8_20_14_0_20_39_15 TaxID=2014273 RepID=A0A2M6XUH3_9BACT|nr:MAG: threonylcarbamoyl-AMP synthase [bacterium (Candidatus Gribaldobacteria) CG08_land_8_20_14_0_20_39_15]